MDETCSSGVDKSEIILLFMLLMPAYKAASSHEHGVLLDLMGVGGPSPATHSTPLFDNKHRDSHCAQQNQSLVRWSCLQK